MPQWRLCYSFTMWIIQIQFSSVAQSCPTLRDPMNCLTILSSVVPFSSCLQSCPTSGSFPISQLFASGGQSIGVSASTSVLPVNTQDWFPLGWTNYSLTNYIRKLKYMIYILYMFISQGVRSLICLAFRLSLGVPETFWRMIILFSFHFECLMVQFIKILTFLIP